MPSARRGTATKIRDAATLEVKARAAGAAFLGSQALAGISAPMSKVMRSGDEPLSMSNFDFLDYQALQRDLEVMRTTLRTGRVGPAHAALADHFDDPAIAATVRLAYMTPEPPDQEEQTWHQDLFRALLIESIPAAKADALLGDAGISVKPLERQLRQVLRAQLEPAWLALGAPRPMPRLVFATPFLGQALNIVGMFQPLTRQGPRILVDSYTLARFLAVLKHPALDDTSPDPCLPFWQKAHHIWGNLGGPGEILLHELAHAADHLVIGERTKGVSGFEVATELGLVRVHYSPKPPYLNLPFTELAEYQWNDLSEGMVQARAQVLAARLPALSTGPLRRPIDLSPDGPYQTTCQVAQHCFGSEEIMALGRSPDPRAVVRRRFEALLSPRRASRLLRTLESEESPGHLDDPAYVTWQTVLTWLRSTTRHQNRHPRPE